MYKEVVCILISMAKGNGIFMVTWCLCHIGYSHWFVPPQVHIKHITVLALITVFIVVFSWILSDGTNWGAQLPLESCYLLKAVCKYRTEEMLNVAFGTVQHLHLFPERLESRTKPTYSVFMLGWISLSFTTLMSQSMWWEGFWCCLVGYVLPVGNVLCHCCLVQCVWVVFFYPSWEL